MDVKLSDAILITVLIVLLYPYSILDLWSWWQWWSGWWW